jgi:hypothetical protein
MLDPGMRDSIKQFIKVRAALQSERNAIALRLTEIEAALGTMSSVPAAAPTAGRRRMGRPPGSRSGSGMNMREAIATSLKNSPMRIAEIVESMKKMGYPFTTKNPKNSVGAFLYGPGKKFFKGSRGQFWNR